MTVLRPIVQVVVDLGVGPGLLEQHAVRAAEGLDVAAALWEEAARPLRSCL